MESRINHLASLQQVGWESEVSSQPNLSQSASPFDDSSQPRHAVTASGPRGMSPSLQSLSKKRKFKEPVGKTGSEGGEIPSQSSLQAAPRFDDSLESQHAVMASGSRGISPPLESLSKKGKINESSGKTGINNSALTCEKILIDNRLYKQYFLHGQLFGDRYPTKMAPSDPTQSSTFIGSGESNTVYARKNPDSPFYVKRAFTSDDPKSMERAIKITNAIAMLVMNAPEKIKGHFAVEVRKKGKKVNGDEFIPTWIVPAVKGFSLADYCKKPQIYPELPTNLIASKLQDLKAAVEWLNANDYHHRDLHIGNVRYDNTKCLISVFSTGATEMRAQ